MNLGEYGGLVVYSSRGACDFCPTRKGCPFGRRLRMCKQAGLDPQPVWEAVEVYGAGYNRAPKKVIPKDARSLGDRLLATVLTNTGRSVGKGQELLDRVLG